jgi:hypothetical protein
MSNQIRELPEQFKELNVFVDDWCFPSQMERTKARQESNMKDITAFYEAMEPKMQEILDYLDTFAIDELEGEAMTLLELTYALAEIAPAVEMFGQKYVTSTFNAMDFLPTHEPYLKRPKMSIAPQY